MAIENYYYPNDINDNKFVFRRVIFMALTGKDVTQNRENIYEKYKEKPQDYEYQVRGIVTLPLNSNITDSQSHSWSESSYYEAIKEAATGVTDIISKKFLDGGGLTGTVVGEGFEAAEKTLNSKAIGAITDMIGVRRPLLNPGYFQNYSKSSLRSFSFSFTFVPENKEESKQIIEIVKFFKKCSSPLRGNFDGNTFEKMGNSFDSGIGSVLGAVADKTLSTLGLGVMLSPMTWEIYVCNDTIRELMSFTRCVCTNVSVTYGESEKVAMFEDGMPKEIKLSLSFSEGQLQFADSYGSTEDFASILAEIGTRIGNGISDLVKDIDVAGGVGKYIDKTMVEWNENSKTLQTLEEVGNNETVQAVGDFLKNPLMSAFNYGASLASSLGLNADETAQSKLPTPEPQKSEDKVSGYRVWEK